MTQKYCVAAVKLGFVPNCLIIFGLDLNAEVSSTTSQYWNQNHCCNCLHHFIKCESHSAGGRGFVLWIWCMVHMG